MQTDPVGYNDGINWYNYCGNNPANMLDPIGLTKYDQHRFLQPGDRHYKEGKLCIGYWKNGVYTDTFYYDSLDDFYDKAPGYFNDDWIHSQEAWAVANGDESLFFRLKVLEWTGAVSPSTWTLLANAGYSIAFNTVERDEYGGTATGYDTDRKIIEWNPLETHFKPPGANPAEWNKYPAEAGLAHEIGHVRYIITSGCKDESHAIIKENAVRYGFYKSVPGYNWVFPRPLTGNNDLGSTAKKAWEKYFSNLL